MVGVTDCSGPLELGEKGRECAESIAAVVSLPPAAMVSMIAALFRVHLLQRYNWPVAERHAEWK